MDEDEITIDGETVYLNHYGHIMPILQWMGQKIDDLYTKKAKDYIHLVTIPGMTGYYTITEEEEMDRTKEQRLQAIEDEARLLREEIGAEKEDAWQVGDCVIASAGPAMICRRRRVTSTPEFYFVYADGTVSVGKWGSVSDMQGEYKEYKRITFKEWVESRTKE